MKVKNGLEIENFSLNLFDALIRFDKTKTLEYLQNPGKKFLAQKEIQKQLLKGFSKPNRISTDVLEKRFRKILEKRQNFGLPYNMMDKFFIPILKIFDFLYSSSFTLADSLRFQNSISFASELSGWSVVTINCLLNYYIDFLRKDVQAILSSEKNHDLAMPGTSEQILAKIVSEPILLWRPLFGFEPKNLLSALKEKRITKKHTDLINLLNDSIVSKDLEAFCEINKKNLDQSTNQQIHRNTIINMILGGIDLNKDDYVTQAIDTCLQTDLLDESDIPLATTVAFGYAYSNNFVKALNILKMLNKDFIKSTPFLPSFIGNIILKTSDEDLAAKWFYIEFKNRDYPCNWPYRVFANYNTEKIGNLEDIIKEIKLEQNFMNREIGDKLLTKVDEKYPNLIEKTLDRFLSSEHKKNCLLNVDDTKDENNLTNFKLKDIHTNLENLTKLYFLIIEKENELNKCQQIKDYKKLQEIAMSLSDQWETVTIELENHTDICTLESYNNDLEIKESSILQKIIIKLDVEYKNRDKTEFFEFEKERASVIKLIKKYELNDLVLRDDITKGELYSFKKDLKPIIAKKEAELKLSKGILSVDEFVKYFKVNEQESLLLNIIENNQNALNGNLPQIISIIDWSSENIDKVMYSFCECLKDDRKKYLEDEFIEKILSPFLKNMLKHKNSTILELIFEYNKICNLILDYLHFSRSEISSNFVSDIHPVDIFDTLKTYEQIISNDEENIPNLNLLLKIYLEKNDKMTICDKLNLLTLYLDFLNMEMIDSYDDSLIALYLLLRNYLIEDSREDEATLLVSAVWTKFRNEKIFKDYDEIMFKLLESFINAGVDNKKIAYEVLQTPNWIIEQKNGLILFLYLCHIGNFIDLIENTRYHYFKIFEEYQNKYPVLVGEYFIEYKFRDVKNDIEENNDKNHLINGINSLEELKHGLKKATCFSSWIPAANYQKYFNEKIKKYLNIIEKKSVNKVKDIIPEINSIDGNEWIIEANRLLGYVVKSPAIDLMIKYIKEQKERLKILVNLKLLVKENNLEKALRKNIQPLKEKLILESKDIKENQRLIKQIYCKIAETL